MYPVHSLAAQITAEWADERSVKLKRPREEILEKGIVTSDFPTDANLEITLMDGSFAVFRSAFFIVSERKRTVAVFTEHCDYHLFPYYEVDIKEIPNTLRPR